MTNNYHYPNDCRCCHDYLFLKEDKLVYRWPLCSIIIPTKPSIDRKNGGHLILFPHRHVARRSELKPQEATALMRASMIIEQAIYDILPSLSIGLVNINIQDNGNFNIDEPYKKRHLHLHFYGRVRDNKNYSHRAFLSLPPRSSKYYKNITPFKEKDRRLLKARINELEKSSKFKF